MPENRNVENWFLTRYTNTYTVIPSYSFPVQFLRASALSSYPYAEAHISYRLDVRLSVGHPLVLYQNG